MADLFEIELADGIPVAGDGKVKTVNALMEDGALATVGNRADPASGVTGDEEASLVAILKQISLVLQQLRADWPDALGLGGGMKIDGSGIPLPVTGNVSITQTQGAVAVTSFTCGTTPYVANAVVGAGGGGGGLLFAGIAAGAASVKIISATLDLYRSNVISGETTYRLYLYNVMPPSALADAAAFDLPAGDRAAFLGFIDFPVIADLGSTLHIELNNINKMVRTASANIYGYLVTVGPFSPTATSYKLTLAAQQL